MILMVTKKNSIIITKKIINGGKTDARFVYYSLKHPENNS